MHSTGEAAGAREGAADGAPGGAPAPVGPDAPGRVGPAGGTGDGGGDGGGAAAGDLRVVVAVLTYRRPDDLAALLPRLRAQAAASRPPAEVLVVDNDPAAGARELVERVAATPGAPLRHVHEARPGIAAARNRALAHADRPTGPGAGPADLLVFLDDDERPADGWLDALLAEHRRSGAAGVVGPVVSRFQTPLDPWITAGGFFERRRLPTGTPVQVAATNNLLLDLRALRAAGVDLPAAFDERFGLSGGSDTLFTRSLTTAGLRLLWCDEALVTDVVPAARASREWVLRRALRSGNSWSRTSLALAGGPGDRWRARVRLTAAGALRAAAGGAGAAAGRLLGRPRWHARGARAAARGLGMAGGAWGWTYAEYARPAAPGGAAPGGGLRTAPGPGTPPTSAGPPR
ncbi:glycosyltransferase family 2 protein [Kineococcus sp. LSe6-4]|uniref:Glycosyltransferase family 2 protein n=1 Tax=Kineococcus halophytocola TaxID=3234027 RepID=A0ABV4GXS2_9ACTN